MGRMMQAAFDKEIGPFEEKYRNLVSEGGRLYGAAKEKHAAGLQVLIDHFNYHPSFKRWNDDFTAVPFRPK